MREAKELAVWGNLQKARSGATALPFEVGNGTSIDLSQPCTVLGGRNGAGKSRLLRRLEDYPGSNSVLIDLHHLTEQTSILYRSQDDFLALTEEVDAIILSESDDRLLDVQRIVGRQYDFIEWFSVELEPDDPIVASRFRWNGPSFPALVPFFRVSYRGRIYTSEQMGLGEFSVHLLFWILEQMRDEEGLLLLLDEPDAYLPPVGVRSLLARLLQVCLKSKWSVILSTHSEEMIALAVAQQGFTLLEVLDSGDTAAAHSVDNAFIATSLLSRPPIEAIVFAEDESACKMAEGLLTAVDPVQARLTTFLWGGGDGYLKQLHEHLPRPPRPDVRFAYAFDGDQRGTVNETRPDRWGAAFLPTNDDPDELMQSLAPNIALVAEKLQTTEGRLRPFLASIEGHDCHDWLNKLGEEFGRQRVLDALPALWAELNEAETRVFVDELRSAWT